MIEATNPEFPVAQLKLIHSGQILKDESTLEEYKIKEDEFLVCMVTKVRPETTSEARLTVEPGFMHDKFVSTTASLSIIDCFFPFLAASYNTRDVRANAFC